MSKNTDFKFAQDAQIVEAHSKLMRENARTRRMMEIVQKPYNTEFIASPGISGGKPKRIRLGGRTQNVSFTKKRRKLPGKRVWNTKRIDFSVITGRLIAEEFNSRQKATPAMQRMFEHRYANGNIKPE